jgi:hypothetical protein
VLSHAWIVFLLYLWFCLQYCDSICKFNGCLNIYFSWFKSFI